MMASHLTEGCKGAERKECNMEVYLTQGALMHHACTRAAAAARWGHRRCSPMRRATWPRAAPQPRMPTGCSARRPLTALGSASSAAACCWAGRSPRRPAGPALTTARAALSRPRQDLEADPALRGSIRMGTRGRRAAQIGDAQGVDLHGHVSNELGQPAVWRVERQGAGTLIATDDLPCMHWRSPQRSRPAPVRSSSRAPMTYGRPSTRCCRAATASSSLTSSSSSLWSTSTTRRR